MNIEIDQKRGEEIADLLCSAFSTTGIHGKTEMPEDIVPKKVKEGSLEHLLFITLTVSIDYLRDADKLWDSARKTYEDPETRYLFKPKSLHEVSRDRIKKDMQKHGLAKRPKQDLYIWRTVGVTFYKKWGGDPRNFLKSNEWDARTILKHLRKDKHKTGSSYRNDYPYLRGPKIGPLWIRMLRDNVGITKIKKLEKVPIPVDRHVARATFATGVLRASFSGKIEEIFEYVRKAWSKSVEGLSIDDRSMVALDVDEPLWHLSKYGCTKRDTNTGNCPKSDSCEAKEFCINGKIRIEGDKVTLKTL
ncbi:hypothetical protein [Methanonatronarchaeum sp. AMET-Sl]|uniref:hypothetical protein n=1 Tax=Methanonatronarchaeum sp. AMET-Sl TaxID=3037654 RepID=UPI00244DF787|nr:hypothetical protein [Methanonatronarchaeum sp. AMET-Sl]WGI17142.1 hypothetical protein QEN48_06480 [Methanonatronarchaeum sp. AMET-Sl]